MGSKENPGLIPRTCEDLFQRIEADASPNVSHSVRVSYFEVYNEHVRDLLGPRRDPPYYLKIRESPTEGPYIKDLTEVPVKSYDEIRRYMTQGDAVSIQDDITVAYPMTNLIFRVGLWLRQK